MHLEWGTIKDLVCRSPTRKKKGNDSDFSWPCWRRYEDEWADRSRHTVALFRELHGSRPLRTLLEYKVNAKPDNCGSSEGLKNKG
jgi:hypothetical protein